MIKRYPNIALATFAFEDFLIGRSEDFGIRELIAIGTKRFELPLDVVKKSIKRLR